MYRLYKFTVPDPHFALGEPGVAGILSTFGYISVRNVVVAGVRCVGRGRKTWDMKLLGLQPEWAVFRDVCRDFILGANVKP